MPGDKLIKDDLSSLSSMLRLSCKGHLIESRKENKYTTHLGGLGLLSSSTSIPSLSFSLLPSFFSESGSFFP